MIKTTRAQRVALFKIFCRDFPSWQTPTTRLHWRTREIVKVPSTRYRMFLKTVRPLVASDPCVMVPWKGMWLGVEPDGYTHS